MPLEGELAVHIAWDGRRAGRVSIRSTRPFAAERVLAGRTSAEAVATVPLLFSVCRRAQGAAAVSAIEAAGADLIRTGDIDARAIPVRLESVQEYISRILIDWPRATGRDAVIAPVAAARKGIEASQRAIDRAGGRADAARLRECASALETTAARAIYGMAPAEWLALSGHEELLAWAGRGATLPAALVGELLRDAPTLGASDVALMPPSDRDALLSIVVPAMTRDADFARMPTWDGSPVETGALARTRDHRLVAAVAKQCGNAVATRMIARLVELALLLRGLGREAPSTTDTLPWVQAFALSPGEGVASVQTARGLLLHRARVVDGRVVSYQIVAPTEWNFHPEGALRRGIEGLAASDPATLERQATLAVQALDPCVSYRIEVGHA